MRFSPFTKTTLLLLIFLVSCQTETPTNTPFPTETATITPFPTAIATIAPPPTSTPDPEIISLQNASQLVLKVMSIGEITGNVAYSPDGKWLYMPSKTGVYAYETTSYRNVHQVSSLPYGTFSPSGKILVRSSDLFLTEDMQKLSTLEQPAVDANPYDASKAFFSRDESLFARYLYFSHPQPLNGIEVQRLIAVWRVQDGKLINLFEVGDAAISPDNRLIAIGRPEQDQWKQGVQRFVYLYDLQTGEELGHWPGGQPVFLSDNSLVVEANGYTRILDPVDHKTRRGFGGKQAVFSADEQSVALWERQYINVYRVPDGKLLSRFRLVLQRIDEISMRFSPDGQTLAGSTGQGLCCGGWMSNLSLWRVSDGALIKKWHQGMDVVFSPDSQTVAVGGEILRTSDGSLIADLSQTCDTSYSKLAFTPDGQQVLLDCHALYLYPVDGESPWVPQKADREAYRSILETVSSNDQGILSPDGKFLARWASTLIAVSSTSGEAKEFYIPGAQVHCLAFSPDHQILALCSKEGSVDLWDVNNQRFAYTILQDVYAVSRLAFSPDGKSLVIRATDGTVRLYGIDAK